VLVLALSNIDAIGWICFAVGVALIVVGALNGVGILPTGAPAKAESKLEDAKQKIDETKGHATRAVAGGGSAEGVLAAEDSAEEAKSALEQVQGIIGRSPRTFASLASSSLWAPSW
jgi:hypothetical protein